MNPELVLQDVQCIRGNRLLFENLNIHISAGQVLNVSGANGSGKTSLLRMVCGLLTPTRGEVLWQGKEIGKLRDEFKRHLLYVGHSTATKDDLTATENLRISATLSATHTNDESLRLGLKRAGLVGLQNAPARLLSQGQRHRLALARLCIQRTSRLWVLDEPFNALDQAAIQWVCRLVRLNSRRGGITVMSSHYDAPLHPSIPLRHVVL